MIQGNIYRDVFPTFLAKKSYGWWITRRKWGFRHKKSEAKYPKVSVATIGKLQEKFRRRTKWLRNWPSAWSDLLPMAVTPLFQLRIAYCLKHWIVDFLIFEMTYSMYKLDFRKCSKSG